MYLWFTSILLLISLIWLKLQNVAACAIAALVCASMSTLRTMKYVSFIGPTVFNERCGRKISNGIWCSPNPTYRASAFWSGRTVTGTSPQPTVFRWWNITITLRLAFLCTWGLRHMRFITHERFRAGFAEPSWDIFWPPPAGGHPNKSTKSNRVSGFAEDFLGLPEVTGAQECINSSARLFFRIYK